MNQPDFRMPSEAEGKFRTLKKLLKGYGSMALAFSGGVDSAFLLAAAGAAEVKCLAVTVISEFFTRKEVLRAEGTAQRLGIEHLCLDMSVFTLPEVVRNDARRCYHCKGHSFSMIKAAAAARGIETLVHGINVDDLGDYRPGIEAAKALGFQAPLVAAGFSKAEVRGCARAMGLSVWNLPSQSCLATRIPVGTEIRRSELKMVERAEDLLHGMGVGQVRVRCHQGLARIEVQPQDLPKLLKDETREAVSMGLKSLGFDFVAVDLGGYETGKMNPGTGID